MTVLDDFNCEDLGHRGRASSQCSRREIKQPSFLLGRASLALAIFSALLASTTPSPLYSIYVAQWDLTQSVSTAIFSVYAIGTLLALFLSNRINSVVSDRRHVLLPALMMTAAGAIVFAMADGVPMLLAGRFLSGISTGLITATASSAIYELTPAEKRHRSAMVATVAFTGGAATGPCVSSAALALDLAPLVTPFLGIAAVSTLAFLGLAVSPWPKSGRAQNVTTTLVEDDTASVTPNERSAKRLFLLSCLTLAVAWILGSILMALGVTVATELFALKLHALAGLTPALFQLFAGIGQVFASRIWSLRAIFIGCAAIALLQIATALAASVPIPFLFVLAMPLCGLSYGAAFVGGAALVNESAPPGQLTRRISQFYVVGYLANSIPTFGMGLLIDQIGLESAFFVYSGVIVCLASGAACYALRAITRVERFG